jgi:hypothetical protein
MCNQQSVYVCCAVVWRAENIQLGVADPTQLVTLTRSLLMQRTVFYPIFSSFHLISGIMDLGVACGVWW